jgi:hypothetical protein
VEAGAVLWGQCCCDARGNVSSVSDPREPLAQHVRAFCCKLTLRAGRFRSLRLERPLMIAELIKQSHGYKCDPAAASPMGRWGKEGGSNRASLRLSGRPACHSEARVLVSLLCGIFCGTCSILCEIL